MGHEEVEGGAFFRCSFGLVFCASSVCVCVCVFFLSFLFRGVLYVIFLRVCVRVIFSKFVCVF